MSALDLVTSAAPAASADPTIAEWFGPRARDVDAGTASVRDGLAELGRRSLPQADIRASVELVRSVAREDLSTAFSAWAHRMTIDYVGQGGEAVRAHLDSLATAETLGVTAMAAGTAHVLAGAGAVARSNAHSGRAALGAGAEQIVVAEGSVGIVALAVVGVFVTAFGAVVVSVRSVAGIAARTAAHPGGAKLGAVAVQTVIAGRPCGIVALAVVGLFVATLGAVVVSVGAGTGVAVRSAARAGGTAFGAVAEHVVAAGRAFRIRSAA